MGFKIFTGLTFTGIVGGGMYALVTQAIKYEEPWAIGILMVISAVALIVLGAGLTVVTQYLQGRMQNAAMWNNAAENSSLIQQIQANDAKTMATQTRATQGLTKQAQLLMQNHTPAPLDVNSEEDLLTFDNDVFSDL